MKSWQQLIDEWKLADDEKIRSLDELSKTTSGKPRSWAELGASQDPFGNIKDITTNSNENNAKKDRLNNNNNNNSNNNNNNRDPDDNRPKQNESNIENTSNNQKETEEFGENSVDDFENNTIDCKAYESSEFEINSQITKVHEISPKELSQSVNLDDKIKDVVARSTNHLDLNTLPQEEVVQENRLQLIEYRANVYEPMQQAAQQVEKVQLHDPYAINISLLKSAENAETKIPKYYDLINEAVKKAMEAKKLSQKPTVLEPLSEIPESLRNNTRIMENVEARVQQPVESTNEEASIELNNSRSQNAQPFQEPASSNIQETLSNIIEETQNANQEYIRIDNAGQGISGGGRAVFDMSTFYDLLQHKGVFFTIAGIITGAITLLIYLKKIPYVSDILSKLLSPKGPQGLGDLQPANTITTSNPITINNNTSGDKHFINTILGFLTGSVVGLSGFLGKKGIVITQKIIRRGK